MSELRLTDVSVGMRIVVVHPRLGIIRSGMVVEIIDGPIPHISLLQDGRSVPGFWPAADMGLIEGYKAAVNKTYRKGEAPKSSLYARFRSIHEDIFSGKPEDDPYIRDALNSLAGNLNVAMTAVHPR